MLSFEYNTQKFLPTSKKEMAALGWDQADIIIFTGDAYVDHPAFGAAVIGRLLEQQGYRVVIVPQPNWRDDLRDFKKMGMPKLFFAVTSGNMDSMVNHYTANKRLRSDDAYTPEGKSGYRPDYAVTVYSQILKQLYPNIPLVIGGVEASLRRLTHYDYWSDCLKTSILVDSGADILVYGMGEYSITEIADRLRKGQTISQMTNIKQTAYLSNWIEKNYSDSDCIVLYSYEDCVNSKEKFGENFRKIESESNKLSARVIVEPVKDRAVIVNPPFPPAAPDDIDKWYDLPYTRLPHPRYKAKRIPAWEMIRFSVNIHRGCFGGCSFCTISAHQGKFIASRSIKSIINEIDKVVQMKDFKGHISDLGGPSANMYAMSGIDVSICGKCNRPSCIYPKKCNNLNTSHIPLINLYKKVRERKGVKNVFIGSGIRYDLFANSNEKYLEELLKYHVSGRLKVAPEHTSDEVLKQMRKPSFDLFKSFKVRFEEIKSKYLLNQELIPYFISSHPGCREEHMQELARETKKLRIKLEQVQDFTPTPMTLASTIYYTGIDPYSGKKIFVARSKEEKLKQNSYFFWYKTKKLSST